MHPRTLAPHLDQPTRTQYAQVAGNLVVRLIKRRCQFAYTSLATNCQHHCKSQSNRVGQCFKKGCFFLHVNDLQYWCSYTRALALLGSWALGLLGSWALGLLGNYTSAQTFKDTSAYLRICVSVFLCFCVFVFLRICAFAHLRRYYTRPLFFVSSFLLRSKSITGTYLKEFLIGPSYPTSLKLKPKHT